jgi:citrate synthase
MSDVLFSLTKDHLETGLRGVPVGYCTTSKVDPELGLFYVGRPVHELAHEDPEDVIHLLLYKRMPNPKESAAFKQELAARRAVAPEVIQTLYALPKSGQPMKWFIHTLNILGMKATTGDYLEDTLRLIARMPTVVAAIYRIREGWGDPIEPDPQLGYMEDFVRMLGKPGLDKTQQKHLTRLLRVFDILHFDHGGGNLSAFSGKAVSSGLADLFESLTAAMCGLAGPRHGKANQECLNFVEEFIKAVGGGADDETVSHMVQARLRNGQLIYGFGHAVLRVEDPRATVLADLGDEICPEDQHFQMVQSLRRVVPPILKENPKISDPYPNVDLVSGSVLHACGLDLHDYFTVLFGMSRVVGIAIQIIYDRTLARGGKGTPIIRPKYLYSETGSA